MDTIVMIIIICLSTHAFGEYQHTNHRYDDKKDTLSFNDSAKNTPLSSEYRDFEEDSLPLTTHSLQPDSNHRFNDSNNSYDAYSHYTDYIDEGSEEINPDTEYRYHDMIDYDDEQDERDDINDRPVNTETKAEHNKNNKKEKDNLILVTPLPPDNYTSYEDEPHSDEISYEDSGEKSNQGVPGTYDSTRDEKSSQGISGTYDYTRGEKSSQGVPGSYDSTRGEKSSQGIPGIYDYTRGEKSSQSVPGSYDSPGGEKSSQSVPGSYDYTRGEKSSQGISGTYDYTRGEKSSHGVPGSYDINSDEKSYQDVPAGIFKLSGEKSSQHVSGAYEVTTQWSEDITPTKNKPTIISQRYADFSENYKKPKYISYYRPTERNNFQSKFKNTVGQVRNVQRPGNVYSSVSKSNGDVYYGYEILHVPNDGQQKLSNDNNAYGSTASPGRVKVQMYRGHSKSDGNNNWYTPWGYYISQPAYS